MDMYITLVGDEYPKAINSLWAVLKQEKFVPDELFLVIEEEKDLIEKLEKDLKQLLENYDINTSVEFIVFSEIGDIRQIIEGPQEDEKGKIALDISSASKLIMAKVLIDKDYHIFDHVFYLEVDDKDRRNPLPTIEQNKVRLRDLKNEPTEAV
ncbi:MAG: hypothetical protein ACLFT7_00120 [Thermoplasmata archaeon]